jgi:hypothetical protein
MKRKWFQRCFQSACLFIALLCSSVSGSLAVAPAPGSQFPPFTLPGPDSQQTQSYLGLKTMEPFTLSAISAKLVVIEFLSAT